MTVHSQEGSWAGSEEEQGGPFGKVVVWGVEDYVEYSSGGGVEGVISWFSSQLHLPEIRRSFCPYVVLLGYVMAQGHGG